MKYESDIAEAIHEQAIANFKIGILSEAQMRKYDEMCLVPEALEDTAAPETVNIEHADLVTA